MSIDHVTVKPLEPQHFRDARLFCDRYELVKHIAGLAQRDGLTNPRIVEIGVALGEFSKFLIDTFSPQTFVAVDLFDLHETEIIWGMPTKELFGGKTQKEYYHDRIAADFGGDLIVKQGFSHEQMSTLEDASFDLIYIDAGHDYESVMKDAAESLKKIKRGGYIIFNDYTMMDHLYRTPFGVVPAANEMIVDTGKLKVIGLGLNSQMFCDLAVVVE
ncbi:class I SAM-dependent methyltransferase [Sphingomonas immobilis]|uniref:Class I SAM-dependent methyltransferase n=1 Tax=Sphingomonas immobilis TaxID=3063997 RepID=A0ABT9A1J6_9SPHN|nr:class I SAM-dependent methyltransferase [Sphingomonas sp. CA1-15]MDO7843702.1 class I SAM-dependent methyltransferase [Sphingomonas sp. CA1-15]